MGSEREPAAEGAAAGETVRQRMIDLLNEGPLNAIDISRELRIPEKEVYSHLPHVAKSLERFGKKLVIQPSTCLSCGYVFEKRRRYTRPGRCPRCKGTHIERPCYLIR